jgi:hypothetical protein
MNMFGVNPEWKKWADKFDVEMDKLVKANPNAWMTIELIIDNETWAAIEKIPRAPSYEMTLPEYFTGKMWDRIRMQRFRKVDREDPDQEIFKFEILRKFVPN